MLSKIKDNYWMSDDPVTVGVIGDAHVRPGQELDRFRWIGRDVSKRKPDALVSIGDFLSLDSLSKHQVPGSIEDFERPSFAEDLLSGRDALKILNQNIKNCPNLQKFITLGNHEERAFREASLRPKECGHFGLEVEQIFVQAGYHLTDYRDFLFLNGVGFTHVPMNGMRKPYEGKNPESNIAKDATFSIVYGHTHKHRVHLEPKIGVDNKVTVFNTGCSLPQGEIEAYAKLATTGWTYMISYLTLHKGQIVDYQVISMDTLEQLYG